MRDGSHIGLRRLIKISWKSAKIATKFVTICDCLEAYRESKGKLWRILAEIVRLKRGAAERKFDGSREDFSLRIVDCKSQFRYSRERAPQKFGSKISQLTF